MINPIDFYIASKLKETRALSKVTQREVGELIGVSLQQIQKYENGTNRISASKLYEFAQVFNKPIKFFFDGYVTDEDFHNIKFVPQKDLILLETKNNQELRKLVSAFNKIKNLHLKRNILTFINSLSHTQ